MNSTTQNKARKVTVRFTLAEFEQLEKRFRQTTCRQLSEYIRKVLANKHITVTYRDRSLDDLMHELIKMRKDFNAVGTNFNQVVRRINAINDHRLSTTWLPYAQTLQQELLKRIDQVRQTIQPFSNKWLPK